MKYKIISNGKKLCLSLMLQNYLKNNLHLNGIKNIGILEK